uniref:Microtubule-associated protein 1Sb n=1 Tax=Labrus bergylta TaxID=56723 RepID=A0A3Q3N5L3_9LABR
MQRGNLCFLRASSFLFLLMLFFPFPLSENKVTLQNKSSFSFCDHGQVSALLSRDSAHKLLILAGQSVEESGELLFHRGLFSPQLLKQILTEQVRQVPATSSKLRLTLSCPNIGHWRKTLLENQLLQGPFTLHINPPEVLPAMEALGEFTSLISGTVSPPSPFDLLPPPITVGFLKLSRPCCYVFPAGRGDCAFFAVNGFTVLMDGGSDSQACFWKLVRHLDRVDAVLLTHIGTENLPGVNTFLERKVAELEMSCDVKGKNDSSKKLISPELGVVFFNAPSRLQVEEHTHQAALTLQLLKKLDIRPHPLIRPQGVPIEPLTLFQKMGVGQLDLYILNPGKNMSALLVWHPACTQEKVVRVLFPGITPQAKLLQGLEKLKGLSFLQKPTVTTGDLERLGEERQTKRTESQDSGRSQGKESTPKQGKDRGGKEEGKEVFVREKGKVFNGLATRDADKKKRCTGEKAEQDQSGNSSKPAKVLGFPSPLNKAPMTEQTVQQDITPTEYTLLDGALRSSPPSRSSPENKASNSNPREKHLSFLSLGSFKDGSSDPSPSFTTTTTTHSMPAEVSSPQSTEVDESLSMSLEQGPIYVRMSLPTKKAPRSLGQGSDMGPHDVDLCLVSPCEFKHFKAPDSSSGGSEPFRGAFHHSHNNNNPKEASPSESNAPVITEDCPSTTADGALDSDEDESCSEPSNSPHDLRTSRALPQDPPPAPLRDSPPLPPHPDASMPVPQSDSDANGKRAKGAGMRGKKTPAVSSSCDHRS